MPIRLSKVDDLILANLDHYYLDRSDQCYFIGEYTARKGYKFSETNGLIYNLKKSPQLRNTTQWYWKEQAIVQAGESLRAVLSAGANLEWLRQAVLVPIPPSKAVGDPLYDDRMLRVLRRLGRGLDLDIRELIQQERSTLGSHETDDRPSPDEIAANYSINEGCCEPTPTSIGIFDDLLTSGSHFKAAQSVLTHRFPNVPIIGVFLARRVPETDDPGLRIPRNDVIIRPEEMHDELQDFVINRNFPDELYDIASQPYVERLCDIEFSRIEKIGNEIRVDGSASIDVRLDYGGGEANDGVTSYESYPFKFSIILDDELKILRGTVEVDTSSFYE